MNRIIVAYEVGSTDVDYAKLYKAIHAIEGRQCQIMLSLWFLKTPWTTAKVRDHIKPHLGVSGKKLFVSNHASPAAWLGLTDEQSAFVKLKE